MLNWHAVTETHEEVLESVRQSYAELKIGTKGVSVEEAFAKLDAEFQKLDDPVSASHDARCEDSQPREPRADSHSLLHFTERFSLRTAVRWRNRIDNRIQELVDDADIWPAAVEDLGIDLRFMPFGKKPHVYRILFTIDGENVNVLRILHAARDWVEADDL